jgi:alanine racemase
MDVTSSSQTRLLVSRSALLHNVRVLRRHIDPATRICAVVKADAYGAGAAIVADALANFSDGDIEAPAVDALAVATCQEAASLAPCSVPIHILRPVENAFFGNQRSDLEQAIRDGHTLTVVSVAGAKDLARIALTTGRRAGVHIMVDTGMCREGCPIDQLPAVAAALSGLSSLRLVGLATHFAGSEDASSLATAEQIRRFAFATDALARANPVIVRHAANSAAVFFHPAAHFDMVRPGLSLLGIDPRLRPSIDRPLRPVMRWTAHLLMVRNVRAGQSVGYNQTFTALRDMRVGLVPVGYADGYCRAFSNTAAMMLHGRPAPVVGRVSMDYVTIDVSHIADAGPGDEVTVLDSDPLSPASAYRLAEIAQTIPYELFTRIGPRVQRIGIEPADQHAAEGASRAA